MRSEDNNTFIEMFLPVYFNLLPNDFSLYRIESTSICIETTLYRNGRKLSTSRPLRQEWSGLKTDLA